MKLKLQESVTWRSCNAASLPGYVRAKCKSRRNACIWKATSAD